MDSHLYSLWPNALEVIIYARTMINTSIKILENACTSSGPAYVTFDSVIIGFHFRNKLKWIHDFPHVVVCIHCIHILYNYILYNNSNRNDTMLMCWLDEMWKSMSWNVLDTCSRGIIVSMAPLKSVG